MKYYALVTLDLEKNWVKIKNLTTTWKVSFVEKMDYEACKKLIKKRLQEAKTKSLVPSVVFAFQLGTEEVNQGRMPVKIIFKK